MSCSKPEHLTAVYIYDFTFLGKDDQLPTIEDFIKLIRPLFKKWVFQLERCPTSSRLHYQGRGSLFKKKFHPHLCSMLNDTPLRGMHVTESSNESKSDEIFYMMKYDTRIEGPYSNLDNPIKNYIPRQYRGLLERLYPFQQSIIDSRLNFNSRHVNFVIDVDGNNGKSTLAALAQLHFKGLDLPPIGDHKELLQIVCDILMAKEERDPQLVFVDLPRALDPKKLGPFMIAVEQIKKGHVCDVRNHYREWWFDSPQVWLFANWFPNINYMSKDRWCFWKISPLKTLLPLSYSEIQSIQSPDN